MNRLIVVVGILFLFVAGSVIPISGFNLEQSNIASTSGDILYVGGSGEGNYTKIQDAIDNTTDGDTIFVYNGNYIENVVINTSISLIGEDRNTTIIDGNKSGFVVDILADCVNISTFTIINGSSNGIVLNSSGNYISGNIISSNEIAGILLENDISNNIIRDNKISSCSWGIVGFYKDRNNITISDNYFTNNFLSIEIVGKSNIISGNHFNSITGIPIRAEGSNYFITENIINSTKRGYGTVGFTNEISFWGDSSVISNNTLINFNKIRGGIGLFRFSKNNVIIGNYISSYDLGGIEINYGTNNTISDNILQDNNEEGITIFFCRKNTVTGNTIKGSDVGILLNNCLKTIVSGNILQNNDKSIDLVGCINTNVSGNAILNNNYGIRLFWSLFSKVYQNNFINNSKNTLFLGLSLVNRWKGNYWDKPRTLPYPIIGRLGILIPWINFDWHPAQEPYDI